MKVSKDGKELKNARVIYSDMSGKPSKVEVDGQIFAANLFEFEEGETKKKTKPATTKRNAVERYRKVTIDSSPQDIRVYNVWTILMHKLLAMKAEVKD